jgi:hypothetical protein
MPLFKLNRLFKAIIKPLLQLILPDTSVNLIDLLNTVKIW